MGIKPIYIPDCKPLDRSLGILVSCPSGTRTPIFWTKTRRAAITPKDKLKRKIPTILAPVSRWRPNIERCRAAIKPLSVLIFFYHCQLPSTILTVALLVGFFAVPTGFEPAIFAVTGRRPLRWTAGLYVNLVHWTAFHPDGSYSKFIQHYHEEVFT